MQEGKVCCFSGHRILRHSEQAIRAALDRQVAHMAQNGYTCFISGAASGFDLLAAEAVLDYKRSRGGVVLKLFLPYADFFDGWSADARRRRLWDRILCSSWPGLSRASTSSSARKAWMPGTRPGMTECCR